MYDQFASIIGKKVKVIDNRAVATSLKKYLERHSDMAALCRSKNEKSKRIFLTTDNFARFSHLSLRFLGEQIETQRVVLE